MDLLSRITELKETDLTWKGIAQVINREFGNELENPLSANAVRKRYERQPKANKPSINAENEIEILVRADEQDVIEKSLRLAGLNSDDWDVTFSHLSFKDDQINVRLGVTPNISHELLPQLESIVDKLHAKAPRQTSRIESDDHLLFVPCIFDAHLEKRAFGANRDAAQDYMNCLVQLTEKATSQGEIGHCLFIIGNDLGNFDNVYGSTTKGTPQDNKYGYNSGIDLRCELMLQAVNYLSERFELTVMTVPGNHDLMTSRWLGKFVWAYYRNFSNVVVENEPGTRKYFQWGKCMFMLAHGEEEKKASIPALMATEQPIQFSQTIHREALLGHFHSYRGAFVPINDENGIICRYMPGLSVTDDWHMTKGYIGNNRGGIGLLYDKENGWVSEFPAFIK